MKLSSLKAPKGARHYKKRVGLGEGSGHGKTSGRGGKGQSARKSGHVRFGFEGGQMPLQRRIPKYGFTSRHKYLGINNFVLVNLSDLDAFDNGTVVDLALLSASGFTVRGRNKAGIKILGNGTLTKKITVKAQKFSETAKAKIEEAGGTCEVVAL